MEHLNQISGKANQVKEATASAYAGTPVEWYVTCFNSLVLDKAAILAGPVWSDAISECSVLSESSYFLAAHGFYEEGSALLRGILESFLTRLYWHIRNERNEVQDYMEAGKWTNDYAKWVMGATDKYPRLGKDVWTTLLQQPLIHEYDRLYRLKSEAETRLKTLDKFVHGRPGSRYYGGAFRSSSLNIRFKPKHFAEWFENLRGVCRIVLVFSFLEYPSLFLMKTAAEFSNLESEYASRVQNLLKTKLQNRAA